MRLKSYQTDSVETAVALARRELGPDAVLVSTSRPPLSSGPAGFYEVVFGVEDVRSNSAACRATATQPAPNPALFGEITSLRQEVSRLGRLIAQTSHVQSPGRWSSSEVTALYLDLVQQEVSPEIAQQVVQRVEERTVLEQMLVAGSGKNVIAARDLHRLLRAELEHLLEDKLAQLSRPAQTRVIAVVGTPGAGKTSSLVKLAMTLGVAENKSMHLVTLDQERVGAVEQMQSYAVIMGGQFSVVGPEDSLSQTVQKNAAELILVDTPGYSTVEKKAIAVLSQQLSAVPAIEVHLVLPATMRATDLRRVHAAYSVCEPSHLLFTHVDAASAYGSLLNEVWQSGRTLSYLSAGRRVPEDLEPAMPERVAKLVMGAANESWQVAA